MFWRRKKEIANDAVNAVTELADAVVTIGPTAILLILGGAAPGAALTYLAHKTRQQKKAAD